MNYDFDLGPEEEKFPRYWIPLLEDPCSQLKGPKCPCNPMPKAEKIGIVGAGMAGLTMAWILQSIGHEVTLHIFTFRFRKLRFIL